MDIEVLGLKVDASGAIVATEKLGASLEGLAFEAESAKAAVDKVYKGINNTSPLEQILTKDTKAMQGLSGASFDAARTAKQLSNEALELVDAQIAAELAIAGTTSAVTLGSKAMTLASAAAARMWAAIGGPAGAAVIAISGVAAVLGEMRQRAEEAADAAREMDEAFTRSVGAASAAELSRKLGEAEAERLRLLKELQAAEPGADVRDLAVAFSEATGRANVFIEALKKIRAATVDSADILRGAFTAELSHAKQELAAFTSGGDAAAEAFAAANREWQRSTSGIVTLTAAIANNDQSAIALLASARELVDVNARLSALQRNMSTAAENTARNLAREKELVAENAAAWVRLSGELMENQKRRAALAASLTTDAAGRQATIAQLTIERDVLLEGAVAYREFTTQQAEAAAIREALTKAEAAGITLSEESISQIRQQVQETEDLQSQIERLKASIGDASGLRIISPTSGEDAQSFTRELQSAVSAATSLSQAFGDSAESVGRLAAGLASAAIQARGISASVSARDAANVGNASYSNGATFSDTAPLLVSTASVFGSVVSIIQGSVNRAQAEVERLRQNAEEFNKGLAAFAAGGQGGVSNARARLEEAQEEAERLADLVERANDPKIADAFRALRANFERIGDDVLKDIRTSFNTAIGNDDANAQQAAIDAYNDRLLNLNDLLERTAITTEEYNLALAQSGVILQTTIAEIEEAAQKAAAAQQRTNDLARAGFEIRALSVTDPRAARDRAFYGGQDEEMFNALERDLDAAAIAALQFAQALEAVAYEARKAEADLRTTESLLARSLNATGNTTGADRFVFDSGQRQELADAIASGMSESNLALLNFTQFAEREQFLLRQAIDEQTTVIREAAAAQLEAIDKQIENAKSVGVLEQQRFKDQISAAQESAKVTAAAFQSQIDTVRADAKAQTDAIDAQLSVAREQSQSARTAVQLLQKQLSVAEKAAESNRAFYESLATGPYSPFSPETQLDLTRDRFESLTAAAQGGDAGAAAELPAAARELLDASRTYNASGPGYVSDFNRVSEVTAEIAEAFGSQADTQRAALTAAERTADAIDRTIEALQSQKEAIQQAAQREIDILQAAKEEAAEQSRIEVQALQDFAEAARAGNQELIDKLTQDRADVVTSTEEQIRLVTETLTAITDGRIQGHEFYTTFLGMTEGYHQAQETRDDRMEQTASAQLQEMKLAVTELRSGFATLQDELFDVRRASLATAAVAQGGLQVVSADIRQLTEITRLASKAPRGR